MMKAKTLFIAFLLVLSTNLMAQYEPTHKSDKSTGEDKPVKAFYAGFGSSLYGKYGYLGGSFGARIAPKTIGEFNVGLGGWGGKVGFALTTNVNNKNSWCPSIGFGRNGGIQGVQLPVTLVPKAGGDEISVTTGVNLDPINVIHLGVQKQIVSKKGGRFIFEFGYSLAVSNTSYSLSDNSFTYNGVLVPTSAMDFAAAQKTVFKMLNPAGIMFNVSYVFGFGNYN